MCNNDNRDCCLGRGRYSSGDLKYNIDTSYLIIFQVFSRDCCIHAYEFFLASLEPSEDTESCSGTLSDAVSLSPLLAFLADTFFLLYALE